MGWEPTTKYRFRSLNQPLTLVLSSIAAGKSYAMVQLVAKWCNQLPDSRIAIFANSHTLLRQLRAELIVCGVNAQIWLGMDQKDDKGDPICPYHKVWRHYGDMKGDPNNLCVTCEKRDDCPLVAQRQKENVPQVQLAAHAMLHHPMPHRKFDLVFYDEDIMGTLIEEVVTDVDQMRIPHSTGEVRVEKATAEALQATLDAMWDNRIGRARKRFRAALSALKKAQANRHRAKNPDVVAARTLRCQRLVKVARQARREWRETCNPEGLITAQDLDRDRLQISEAIRKACQRPDGKLRISDLPNADSIEFLRSVYENLLDYPKAKVGEPPAAAELAAMIAREVPLRKAADALAALAAALTRAPTPVSNQSDTHFLPGVVCRGGITTIKTLRPPHRDYNKPSWCLSATAEPVLYKKVWSEVEIVVEKAPPGGGAKVIRVEGAAATKSSLIKADKLTKLGATVAAAAQTLVRQYDMKAQGAFDFLIVAQQAVENALSGGIGCNPRAATGHFNAMQGLNAYKDVRAELIVGQPLPTMFDLLPTAEAIQMKSIPYDAKDPRWRRHLKEGKARDGKPFRILDYYHENEILDALLQSIVHGGVAQADRTRLPWRGEDNPVDLYIFNRLDLSRWLSFDTVIHIDEVAGWQTQLLEHGILPASSRGAHELIAALLPECFKSAKAVANKLQSGGRLRAMPKELVAYRASVRLPGKQWIAVDMTSHPEELIPSLIKVGRLPEGTEWRWRRLGRKQNTKPSDE